MEGFIEVKDYKGHNMLINVDKIETITWYEKDRTIIYFDYLNGEGFTIDEPYNKIKQKIVSTKRQYGRNGNE